MDIIVNNMKKIVRITESDIKRIVNSIIKENDDTIGILPSFTVEPNVRKQPREKEIEGLFGKYEEQIPPDIIRYMRKNPQLIMDRMARIYGKKFIEYVDKAYVKSLNLGKEDI